MKKIKTKEGIKKDIETSKEIARVLFGLLGIIVIWVMLNVGTGAELVIVCILYMILMKKDYNEKRK